MTLSAPSHYDFFTIVVKGSGMNTVTPPQDIPRQPIRGQEVAKPFQLNRARTAETGKEKQLKHVTVHTQLSTTLKDGFGKPYTHQGAALVSEL